MNIKMNLISVVPFLLYAVAGNTVRDMENVFSDCRIFLDVYSMTDCQRAQNIHLCTEMLNGRIGSRGNQELDRLKCRETVKDCKTINIQKCRFRPPTQCSNLKTFKNCLYQQNCTEHYQLLDKYYTDGCLKTICKMNDIQRCSNSPAANTTKSICRNLEREYTCVLKRHNYVNSICKMPAKWQKDYKDYACEDSCYDIAKPYLSYTSDEEKCNTLNSYKLELDKANCKIPDDMEKEYKSSKCDTHCNINNRCTIFVDGRKSRKINCQGISVGIKCLENANCSPSQYIYDAYAFYECSTSCDGNVLNECIATLKQPINSTRKEQCGYYREKRECHDKAKCEINDEVMKLLECSGAASWNTMLSIIISVLLAVQMLEKYISLS